MQKLTWLTILGTLRVKTDILHLCNTLVMRFYCVNKEIGGNFAICIAVQDKCTLMKIFGNCGLLIKKSADLSCDVDKTDCHPLCTCWILTIVPKA